jgi:putative SOS response-associated peptidase YedK
VRIHNLFCSSASGPLDPLLWGLIPYGCSDPKGGPKPINAKSETAASDWSAIVRRRRCVLRSNRYVALISRPMQILPSKSSLIGIVFSIRFHET